MNPAIITHLDLTLAAPEIFILSAACIILLIDLFLDERTRWESFVLSLFALAGAAWVTAKTGVDVRTVAWHGTYVADPVGNLLKIVAYGAVAVVFLYSYGYLEKRGLLQGRVLRAGALRAARHHGADLGEQPGHDLPRGRAAGAVALCAGRDQSRFRRVRGGGDQVLRAGLDRLGRAALRHVHHLRRDRLARARGRGQGRGRSGAEPDRAAVRPRVPDRRRRVQVRRRAVPHVGPGRVPRRPDGRDAVPELGSEARVVRARVPAARRRASRGCTIRAGRTC